MRGKGKDGDPRQSSPTDGGGRASYNPCLLQVRDLAKFKAWIPNEFHSLYPDPPATLGRKRKRDDGDEEDDDDEEDEDEDEDDQDEGDEDDDEEERQ